MDMTQFFTLQVDQIIKIIIALVLGGIVGIEREKNHKPAGLRTHALVCVGSTLITIIALDYFHTDSARIIANIITGIGFLGAGTIIGTRDNVHGLTTAACLWGVAAIGIGVGVGAYALSVMVSLIVLIVLFFGKVERNIKKRKR